MNLYEKLIEVRKNLPYFQKTKQSFGYKYVKGQDILAKVQEKTNELKILFFPEIVKYEIVQVDTGKRNEKKPEITEFSYIFKSIDSFMRIIDAESGEVLLVPFAFVGEQNDPAKAYGSALTYLLERYFLMKFFNIPTDEDDPDKWDEKHDDENLLDKIDELFIQIKQKGILHSSEIEPIEQQILEANTDKKKKSLIAFFESKLKEPSYEVKLRGLRASVNSGLISLKYEETHKNNSIKKHLGTDTVDECKDAKKLFDYVTYLRNEYSQNKTKEQK